MPADLSRRDSRHIADTSSSAIGADRRCVIGLSRSSIALRIMGRPPTTEGKVHRHARRAVNARNLRQAPPEPVPDPIEAAVAELTSGHRIAAVAALEADPRGTLSIALA